LAVFLARLILILISFNFRKLRGWLDNDEIVFEQWEPLES
jgi:hypothetical protein